MPFSLLWSASVNTLLSEADSTSVLISAAVWSAVADASIPSNLLPSVATSLPSTVPDTVIFPVTSIPAEKSWLALDVIGPLLDTATEAEPFCIVVLSTAVVDVAVTIPFALTVTIGIAVLEPTVPALTPESASLLFAIAADALMSAFTIVPSTKFALATVTSEGNVPAPIFAGVIESLSNLPAIVELDTLAKFSFASG